MKIANDDRRGDGSPPLAVVEELRARVRGTSGVSGRGTDLHGMRATNRLLILNYIREHADAIRRADLARLTGLSRTAVGNIVEDLIQSGLVREEDLVIGGDRRTIPLRFHARAGLLLACVLGRAHMTLMLTDLTPTVVQRAAVPFAPEAGPERSLPAIEAAARAFVAEAGVPWDGIAGVGVGIPGPVGRERHGTIAPTYMQGWQGVDIQRRLEEQLGLPVLLDNNAILGALGEQRFGAGRDVNDMLYVRVGSGIGGGLLLEGHLYRGSGGTAGEIGHMPIAPDGSRCTCGNTGCLETLAGAPAIIAAAQASDPALQTIAQVIAAARAGNPAARAALARAGEALGRALAALINVFDPTLIVLDGGTIQAEHWLLDPLRHALDRHALRAPLEHARVATAALQGDASALGGIALLLDAIFGQPGA